MMLKLIHPSSWIECHLHDGFVPQIVDMPMALGGLGGLVRKFPIVHKTNLQQRREKLMELNGYYLLLQQEAIAIAS